MAIWNLTRAQSNTRGFDAIRVPRPRFDIGRFLATVNGTADVDPAAAQQRTAADRSRISLDEARGRAGATWE